MPKVQVKSFLRKGKVVKSFLRNNKKAVVLSAGVSATVAVPTLGYAVAKKEYRKNIPSSAEMARKKASTIKVDKIPENTKQISIVSGGFAGLAGKAGLRLKKYMKEAGLDNQNHIDVINNKEFDIAPGSGTKPLKFVKETNLKLLETTLKGKNPVSVRMAATAYAYHRKYPDKDINLIGHSAGGLIASEASEILDHMGVKTKTVTIGSPNYGFMDPKGKTLNITSKKDIISKLPRRKNAKYINSVDGHVVKKYLADKTVRKELRTFLEIKENSNRPG